MRRLVPIVLVLSLLLVGSGCSTSKPGEKVVTPTPTKVVGTVPKAQTVTVPAKFKHGDPTAGETIFKTGPCASCHTLAKAGTHGTVGPNLDQAKPPLSRVVDRVINGRGIMPPFRSQFSDKQIADIAAFVVQATGGNPNG